MTGAGPLPEDHDCDTCGCEVTGRHLRKDGLCLACGGCCDPSCCQHDADCIFDSPVLMDAVIEHLMDAVIEREQP